MTRSYSQMEPSALLQDDNARPHRVMIVDAYLQQQHITRIDWPACSPDLNPIEHVWDQLGRAVQARLNVNSTRADLRMFLVEEWDRLPQDNVQRMVHSMRRRCAACIAARGGPTHYWCNESIKWLWSPLATEVKYRFLLLTSVYLRCSILHCGLKFCIYCKRTLFFKSGKIWWCSEVNKKFFMEIQIRCETTAPSWVLNDVCLNRPAPVEIICIMFRIT